MGSLASRPKAPDIQPVPYVYVPAPAAPAASVTTPPATVVNPESAPDSENGKDQARAANLLERRRGRLSTVLTGFRGLLSDTMTGARKTLLGE